MSTRQKGEVYCVRKKKRLNQLKNKGYFYMNIVGSHLLNVKFNFYVVVMSKKNLLRILCLTSEDRKRIDNRK
jgi:hypothetical protein